MTLGEYGLKAYGSHSCSGIETRGRNKIRSWGERHGRTDVHPTIKPVFTVYIMRTLMRESDLEI
jgi:hypothetical protein